VTGRRTLHPELTAGERRRLFREGVERYNRGDYFDAHESWEEIWRSTTPEPRDLFQGLIQVTVAMYHYHVRERPPVARRVLGRGRRRLEPFAPGSHGLDLAHLLAGVRRWEAWLAAPAGDPPPVPRLQLDPDR